MIYLSEYRRILPKIFGAEWAYKSTLLSRPESINACFYIEETNLHVSAIASLASEHIKPRYEFMRFFLDGSVAAGSPEWFENNNLLFDRFSFLPVIKVNDFKSIRKIVIYISHPGEQIYGHWLIDIIPAILLLKEVYEDDLKVLFKDSFPFFTRPLLEFFGIEILKDIPEAASIVIFGKTRYHDYLNTQIFELYSRTINKRKSEFVPFNQITNLLYVSRRKLSNTYRNLSNRDEVEELFLNSGFEIFYPEDFSLEEQIRKFSSALILAGEGGSGLHNSVFCCERTHIINIQSSRQSHFIQSSLCGIFGQQSTYVFGKAQSDDWNSSYSIDPDICNSVVHEILKTVL